MTPSMLQLLGVQVGTVQPLQVGEQRVMSGIRKEAVHGPAVWQVTQPRGPCYKLNAAMDDPTAVRTMARSGLSGFYLAVDVPGSLMAGQAFEVVAGPREMPVMDLFSAVRAKVR